MQTNVIQRQYDEVIAEHYDLDTREVTGRSLDRALRQIRTETNWGAGEKPVQVLDLGLGTGSFLAKLRASVAALRPFGIDLSQRMVDIACAKVPDLTATVDDVANLDGHFPGQDFDLICTHYVTGFVPATVLAPKIWNRLTPGGYWSFVGGTKAGFPVLQKKTNTKAARLLFRGHFADVDDRVCNPADRAELLATLEGHGFDICQCETFRPRLDFKNLDEFLAFAYYGGWLTPFVEALGLHKVRGVKKAAINALFFPVTDHHTIEIVLARRMGR
jgi:ubiquinone/menaquinone biosynthesis C-methylase UbiE